MCPEPKSLRDLEHAIAHAHGQPLAEGDGDEEIQPRVARVAGLEEEGSAVVILARVDGLARGLPAARSAGRWRTPR